MIPIKARATIEIPRPVAEVFAYFADIRNEPDWNHGHVHSIRKVTEGPIGLDTVFLGGHAGFGEASWHVTEYDAPHHVRIDGRVGQGTYSYDGRFTPTPGGTHMEGTVEWRPVGAFARLPFLRALLRARARRSFRNFANHFPAPTPIRPKPSA